MVLSDIHRSFDRLYKIIKTQNSVEFIIFLGDGCDDIERAALIFPNKKFIKVKGNNDFSSNLNVVETPILYGMKFFITHGHSYNVKLSTEALYKEAAGLRADILLFGHTHTPFKDYKNGMHILNPGSLIGHNPTYGFIDIFASGSVFTNIVKLSENA